ncbi:MAG: NAD-dependent epimerase/dehydratase family protein [Candidatus Aenigmarchaeota archaeon]|nr:NAD-dependent epimerase/dehydratase family protein [Candidatus Aenigmarchaeota archaeon]
MKICITGGSGFIGSNLARKLVREGHEIKIIDDMSSGSPHNIEDIKSSIEFEKMSILENEKINRHFKNIDIIVHLAAKTSIIESQKNPGVFIKTNVEGTKNVLDACKTAGVKMLIFSSSAAVYSEGDGKINEKCPTEPSTVYGDSKLRAEGLIRKICPEYEIDFCILRLFNVYGPRQVLEGKYASVVPKFLASAMRNKPITVNGGRQSRDFIFVDDVSDAFFKVIKLKNCKGSTINIGTGRATKIADLAKIVKETVYSKSEIHFMNDGNTGLNHSCADPSLSCKLLGTKNFAGLRMGLRKTADWIEGAM